MMSPKEFLELDIYNCELTLWTYKKILALPGIDEKSKEIISNNMKVHETAKERAIDALKNFLA
jgi:hypothetical protein